MLADWALRWSRLTVVALVLLVGAGAVLYPGFPAREDPQFTVREATVTARNPGMAPERMTDLVVRPLEEAIQEIPEVRHITATVRAGEAIVRVRLKNPVFDVETVWDKLRETVNDTRGDLPPDTEGPTVDDDVGDVAAAVVALTADGMSRAEHRETAREVRRRLYTVDGVGKVRVSGMPEERIYLDTTNAQLARYGINPTEIINTLQARNVIHPGGEVEIDGTGIAIEPRGKLTTAGDIGGTVLATSERGGSVYLRDLVDIRRERVDQPRETAYYNGERAVVLAVVMREGANMRAFGERLTRELRAVQGTLPVGFELAYATYKPGMVEKAVSGFTSNLYQTIAVVLLVVVAFLGVRAGLVAGAIVPLTMLAALVGMQLAGIPLHRVSIAALIVAMGLLVDNGVVVTERIRLLLDRDTSERDRRTKRRAAAVAAGRELALPLLTASGTTVLFFIPLMLAEHPAGEYMRGLSLVVMFSLAASWVLAMTAIPFFAAHLVRPAAREGGTRMRVAYRWLLGWALRLRWVVLGAAALATLAALAGLGSLPRQFFPPSDRAQMLIDVDLPRNATRDATREQVRAIERWLREDGPVEALDRTVAYAGYGGPRFYLSHRPGDPGPDRGTILATLAAGSDAEAAVRRTRAALQERFPQVRTQVKTLWLGPVEQGLVRVRLSGPDPAVLTELGERVKALFRDVGPMAELKDDWRNKVAYLDVRIDQDRARRAGVTREAIVRSLEGFFDGAPVTRLREGRDRIPILLRGAPGDRGTLDRLRSVNVYPQRGERTVPLSQVADFRLGWRYAERHRRDLEPTLTVSAKSTHLKASQVWDRVKDDVAALDMPPGYRWELGGELEKSREARAALFAFMPVAVGVMALILVWQFNSIRRTAIIALTIPLSLIGAVAGLHAGGAVFGFTTILGLLSLFGIIINNGIVMLSRVDQLAAETGDRARALIDGAGERLRPILMTTLTTSFGLLPLMLFGGEMWYGLTVAVSAGLLGGSLLTLVVVPCLYAVLLRVPVRQG